MTSMLLPLIFHRLLPFGHPSFVETSAGGGIDGVGRQSASQKRAHSRC
jgi:hypothetical protein